MARGTYDLLFVNYTVQEDERDRREQRRRLPAMPL